MYLAQQITSAAPYPVRDGASAAILNGKMYMGGGVNTALLGDLWSMSAGEAWTPSISTNLWKNHSVPMVECSGRLVRLGTDGVLGNGLAQCGQVYSWAEGEPDWTLMTASAPWGVAGRVLHSAWVIGSSIYVGFGQSSYGGMPGAQFPSRFFTDVWRSDDGGATWTQIADDLPVGVRSGICGVVVVGNEVFLIGGGSYDTADFPTRVYQPGVYAFDCVTLICRQVTPYGGFIPALYASVELFDGRMWIAGGNNAPTTLGDIANIFSSADGKEWTQEFPNSVPWVKRHAAVLKAFNGALYWFTGDNYQKDVWKITNNDAPPVHFNHSSVDTHSAWSGPTVYTLIDRTIALTPGATVASIGMRFKYPQASLKMKIARELFPGRYDVLFDGPVVTHPGGDVTVDYPVSITLPTSGVFRMGASGPVSGTLQDNWCSAGQRAMGPLDLAGSNVSLSLSSDGTFPMQWTQA